jgi:ABC-type spermidine/putrescine transport system permease subunit II
MQNVMNLIVLMCAAVAALAFGVLAAYGICRAAFGVLKVHARSCAKVPQPKPEVARIA